MIRAARRLRARTRLTLWYIALLAGTLLAIGGATLWSVAQTLASAEDALLRSRANELRARLEVDKGRLKLDADDDTSQMAALTTGLDLARVWDGSGHLILERAWSGSSAVGLTAFGPALAGESASTRASVASGASFRLYTEPVLDHGRVVGALQVGRSSAELDATLTRLGSSGLLGLAAAMLLAWIGGSFLAARALAPVDRIRRAAEQLSVDDLSARLGLTLPDDELGRLAIAFDGMLERLDRAFQRQRRFTADAAHELRTPLAVIRSEVDVALARPRDAGEYIRVLASAREEVERLTHLTESLLVLARADEGQELSLAPLDLEELVAEVGARMTTRTHQRGLRLGVELTAVGPVRGDPTWLTQLLLNLLDNAFRHTPPGGTVTVTLSPVDGGARLQVADTGEGIPPEHLERVFERFYRADRARSRAAGGAGLGLAICDWIARAHAGRLEIASQPGQGTSVSLWLPTAPPEPELKPSSLQARSAVEVH